MSLLSQYKAITNRELLCVGCGEILKDAARAEDPYWEYTDSIASGIRKLEPLVSRLSENRALYLPQDYLQKLMDTNAEHS